MHISTDMTGSVPTDDLALSYGYAYYATVYITYGSLPCLKIIHSLIVGNKHAAQNDDLTGSKTRASTVYLSILAPFYLVRR